MGYTLANSVATSGRTGWPSIYWKRNMIFITVGTQIPFRRLVSEMAKWATKNPGIKVIAQVGVGGGSFDSMECHELIDKSLFDSLLSESEIIVAHAGMGSILSALTAGKPVIVLPRRFEHGEHRNDHQIATARVMEGKPGIKVIWDELELSEALNARESIKADKKLDPYAPESFTNNLKKLLACT